MADERDDDRDRESARLFRGTPARGQVFDSLDSLTWTEPAPPRAPAAPAPPPAAVEPPPVGATDTTTGEQTDLRDDALADDGDGDDRVGDDRTIDDRDLDDRDLDGPDLDDRDFDGPAGGDRAVARPRPTSASSTVVAPTDSLRWRVLTVVAVVLAAAGVFLVVFPFDVSAGGVTARCGPPVYEVLVPTDTAFDVAENALCGSPAQHRLLAGIVVFAGFLVIAFARQWSERARRRRARRARRARARAAKHGSGRSPRPPGTGGPAAGTDGDDPEADDERVPAGPHAR